MSDLLEIQWRLIHPHPSWPDAATDPVAWIDPSKFDLKWQRSDQWVGLGGVPGGHDSRYPRAGEWICNGKPTDMCQIYVNEDGVGFIDGRHRFAWLRDHGVSAIPVQLSPESLAYGIGSFETDLRTSTLQLASRTGSNSAAGDHC